MNNLNSGKDKLKSIMTNFSQLSSGLRTSVFPRKNLEIGCENVEHLSPNLKSKKLSNKKSMSPGSNNVVRSIKRRNWEDVNLFGPLLMTATQRRKNALREMVDANIVEAECSGLIAGGEFNREQRKHVKIRVNDSSFDSPNSKIAGIMTQVRDTVFEFASIKTVNEKNLITIKSERSADISVGEVKDMSSSKLDDIDTCTLKSFTNLKLEETETLNLKKSNLVEFVNNLCNFPLCINDDKESLSNNFNTYCRNMLEIEDGLELFQGSVTAILQQTMSEESRTNLKNWENKMIEKLGFDGFKAYKQELFDMGRSLHKQIENRLSGQIVVEELLDDRVRGYWRSVQHVLQNIQDVQMLETKIQHPLLRYKGVLDCVAKYRDFDVVVEWKTSQRPRSSLKEIYDNPLQVAAYTGALNYSRNIKEQVSRGIVIVAYSSGAPADLHYMDIRMMEHFWTLWLQRLEKYLLQIYQKHL